MGSVAIAGAIISGVTAAVSASAAVAKGVRAKKDREAREVKQGEMQEQLKATKGSYEAYRGDAERAQGQAMHASMAMYGPVWDEMENMYPGWKKPDFEAAMRANESRADPASAPPQSRPLNSRPDPEQGSRTDPASGHTYDTDGQMSRGDVDAHRGSSTGPMNTTGNRPTGRRPMNTTGKKTGDVGGH